MKKAGRCPHPPETHKRVASRQELEPDGIRPRLAPALDCSMFPRGSGETTQTDRHSPGRATVRYGLLTRSRASSVGSSGRITSSFPLEYSPQRPTCYSRVFG